MNTRLIASLARAPLALKRGALSQFIRAANADYGEHDHEPIQDNPQLLPGGIMVLPVRGLIAPRIEDVGYCDCVVTLMEPFIAECRRIQADDSVRGVVLDISSPGGIVWLVPEAARALRELAAVKPVHGVANAQAASAAFYLLAACGKRYITRSGEAGSVGVWTMHVDESEFLKKLGFDVTLISEGEHKVDGHPFAPLSDEVEKMMQADTRKIYEMFRDDVASYTGVTSEKVEKEWMALCYFAGEAVANGMVHGVATLEEVVAGLQGELQPTPDLAPEPREAPGNLERRTFDGSATVDGRTLAGSAVRYSSASVDLGGFREVFEPGAFAEAITTNADDLRVIWQHDGKYVFGRVKSGTAEFRDADTHVAYSATPPDAQWARDAMESIRRGDVDQSSFAFMVAEPRKANERFERRSDGIVYRVIKKARLVEAGPQTHAAYQDTSVAVRSYQAALAENAIVDLSAPRLPSIDALKLRAIEATLG